MEKIICVKNEDETRKFGTELGREAKGGQVLALVGDLGTGKTALTRYIAEGLGVTETISSPTFTIVKEYYSGRLPLYHFDIYRVNDPDELYEIGMEEYLYGEGLCVVEWADLAPEVLPKDATAIKIEYGEDEEERIYHVYSCDRDHRAKLVGGGNK